MEQRKELRSIDEDVEAPITEEELTAWEERAKGPKDWSAYYILRLIAEVRRLREALAANGGVRLPDSGKRQSPAETQAVTSADTGTSLLAMIEEIWGKVPDEEMEKLPTDLAEQHDHYVYGLPKRGP
jgi:hypothetical protein